MVSLLLLLLPQAGAEPLAYADALREALASNPALLAADASATEAEGQLISAKGTFDPQLSAGIQGGISNTRYSFPFLSGTSEARDLAWSASLSQYLATGTSMALTWTDQRSRSIEDLVYLGATESDKQDYKTFSPGLSLDISQAILQGHRTAWNLQYVHAAKRNLSQVDAQREAQRLQTVADTAIAYWNLHYQQALLDIATEAVAVATEEQRVVEAMVGEGKLAPVEQARVDAMMAQARSNLIYARGAHLAAADALAALMGRRLGDVPLEAISAPEAPTRLDLDEARVVEAALAGSPEIAQARLCVEQAEEGRDNARHALLPELNGVAGLGLSGYSDGRYDTGASMGTAVKSLFNADLPTWYLGAQLSVPLGNRADRGAAQSAGAALVQCQRGLDAAEQALTQQVRVQLRNVEAGAQAVELAEANLKAAEITLGAEKAMQREGRAIQKDVLQAETDVSRARAELAHSKTAFVVAMVELGRLQGRIEGVGE